MAGIFGSIKSLVAGSRRVALSRYPSSRTPELKQAWSQPQFKWTATPQPYTSPLSIYQGNNWLNGETNEMRREYRVWAFREPSVKAALITKCNAVASLDPQWIADDKQDAQDLAAAKWCDWAVSRAEGGHGKLLNDMLVGGTMDGYSVQEPVRTEVEDHKKYKGWWTVGRFAQIDTENLRFRLDQYRQVVGVRPMTPLSGFTELPPEDFLIFTHLKLFENPFGISDLRSVVRDCRLLEDAITLRHTLLANWSGPFIRASHADETTRRQMMSVLERARAAGYIVVPAGTEMEVLNLATSSPQVFDTTIAFYREQIIAAIQGSYLQLLSADGERGNSLVAKSVSELFTWWLAMTAAEVVNRQLVPSLVRPNLGNSVGLPRLSLGGINEAMVSAALDRFIKLQSMGAILSKAQIMDVGGAETPSSPEDELKPPGQQPAAGAAPDPFGMSSRAHVGTDSNLPTPNLFAEWKPYTNPDDGRQGYISTAGQVRYDAPPQATKEPHDEYKREAETNAEATVAGVVNQYPQEGKKPGFAARVKEAAITALAKTYMASFKLIPVIQASQEVFEAVFDTGEDVARKMGYNPGYTENPSAKNQDAFRDMTGLSTHLAATIAAKVIPAAIQYIRSKIGGKATNADNVDAIPVFAQWLAGVLNSVGESLGEGGSADVSLIERHLRKLQADPNVRKMDDTAKGGTPAKGTFRYVSSR